MTKDEALDLALEALTPFSTPNWAGTGVDKANEAITAIKQARSAPVQVFDHVNAARQGLRDAQNRSRLISNLINCGTCGYPLAPEERTSLIERDGVMVKPAPVQEPMAWTDEQLQMLNFLYGSGEWEGLWFDQKHPKKKGAFWWRSDLRRLFTTPPAAPVQKPVWIRPDDLQKAQKAPFLCRVEPNKRDDFVPLYAIKDKNG